MPTRRVGTSTLGLALLIVGGALLYTEITGVRLNLWRYWPVLLVLLGLEVLLAGSRADGGRIRLGISGLALLGLVILLATASWYEPFGLGLSSCSTGRSPLSVQHREDRGELALDWTGVEAVAVDTVFGTVSVLAGQTEPDQASTLLEVTGQGPTANGAEKATAAAGVRATRAGSLLTLSAFGERTGVLNTSAAVNIQLLIPADIEVRVSTEHGRVTVEGCQESVDVNTRFGRSVTLRQIAGPVTVATEHGAIDARGLAGTVTATSTYGSVDLFGPAGPVTVEAKHGRVDLSEPGGPVSVETTYGRITIRYGSPPAGPCQIESRHGSILVEVPQASSLAVDAVAARSRITTNLSGLEVTTEGSGSRAAGLVNGEGTALTARTEYGRLELRGY